MLADAGYPLVIGLWVLQKRPGTVRQLFQYHHLSFSNFRLDQELDGENAPSPVLCRMSLRMNYTLCDDKAVIATKVYFVFCLGLNLSSY